MIHAIKQKLSLKIVNKIPCKTDLSGAFSTALLHIPASMSYGIIVFMPLGSDFTSQGAVLGVYGAIIVGFFAALLGGTSLQITGPIASISLILASIVVYFSTQIPEDLTSRQFIIIALVSLCIFLGGVFQILFGLLRLGKLMKYIPHQVIAGFSNGIALILLLKQIKPMLGVSNGTDLFYVISHPEIIAWTSLLVGGITLTVIQVAKIRFKSNAAFLYGLVAGSLVHALLTLYIPASQLGGVIGHVKFDLPKPVFLFQWLHLSEKINIWAYTPHLLLSGFVLAVIGSIHSLLSSMVSDTLTKTHHRANREIIGQGIGNIIGSFFGALFSAGAVTRMTANYKAGGKTRASGILSSVFIFIIMMFAGSFTGKIPLSVLAAIIISIAIGLFDRLTVKLLRQAKKTFSLHRDIKSYLTVSLLVTITTISINLIVAIILGIVAASVIFISKMGKKVIKSKYHASTIHSKTMRSQEETAFLQKEGSQIAVFELQGPIFFGSAEGLIMDVQKNMEQASYCILDIKHVNHIDINGINSFRRVQHSLEKDGKHLLISGVRPNTSKWQYFNQMDAHVSFYEQTLFPDLDRAMEWAENHLLDDLKSRRPVNPYCPLEQHGIFKGFEQKEVELIKQRLSRKNFFSQEKVYKKGDACLDLYIIIRGSVSLTIFPDETIGVIRLYSLSSGLFFGETALFEMPFRLSDAIAEGLTELYILSRTDYRWLVERHPATANKLIINIASEISRRQRLNLVELTNNY